MLRRFLARWQAEILDHPRRVVAAALLAGVAAFAAGLQVELRTSRSELAPPSDPEQARFRAFIEDVGGDTSLVVCLQAASPEVEAADLRPVADAVAAALRALPVVRRVFYRVDLDWFQRHALYLVPPERLEDAAGLLDRERETVASLAGSPNLAEFNRRAARALREAWSRTGPGGVVEDRPLSFIETWIQGELRFLEDPPGFLARLRSTPPLLALSGGGPLAGGYLSSRRGDKLFLVVTAAGDDDSLPALRRFVAEVRAAAREAAGASGLATVALTGQPAMTVEEMDTVKSDTWKTSTVALLGVTMLTLLVFRWKRHAFLVLAALSLGILWAFGAVWLELGYLNMITSSFISTLVGVGVAYGIHPVSEYELEGAHTTDPRRAVQEAYHRTGAPVTVAAVTTAAAFFSILLMRFRGFSELGLVAGVGVLLCLLAALTVLPAMLLLYGEARRRKTGGRDLRSHAALDLVWMDRASRHVVRFPKTLTLALLALTGVLAWHAREVRFNTNLLDLLPRDAESLRVQRELMEDSEFSSVAGVVTAQDLESLREMRRRAGREPAVSRFESVLDFLPDDPERSRRALAELGTRLAPVRLTESPTPLHREALAASFASLEAALGEGVEVAFGAGLGAMAGSLESAREAAEQAMERVQAATEDEMAAWNEGQRALHAWAADARRALLEATRAEPPSPRNLPEEILQRFRTRSGAWVAYLQPAGDVFDPGFLETYVVACRRVSRSATGFPLVFHHVSHQITRGFYQAVAAGALLVFLILLVDLRSLRDTLMALMPLGVGILWTIGWMGWTGLTFNFANLVAVPLIIGVGIDNGVHVMHRVRLEGADGMRIVLQHTGRAVLIASLTTMLGFGSLALASHRGMASLGLVLLLGVASCLVTALVLLPNLLVATGKVKG